MGYVVLGLVCFAHVRLGLLCFGHVRLGHFRWDTVFQLYFKHVSYMDDEFSRTPCIQTRQRSLFPALNYLEYTPTCHCYQRIQYIMYSYALQCFETSRMLCNNIQGLKKKIEIKICNQFSYKTVDRN